jgi:hypothetical protein
MDQVFKHVTKYPLTGTSNHKHEEK